MRLYFLRHADALPGIDDAIRPLSDKGREQSRRLGAFLKESGVVFDVAYTSPLVRARQTAEIVLGEADGLPADRLKESPLLLNDASSSRFTGWLRCLEDHGHVLLVGHAPTLEERVRVLMGVGYSQGLTLPKGGLACVKSEDGQAGMLKWFITPKLLLGRLA